MLMSILIHESIYQYINIKINIFLRSDEITMSEPKYMSAQEVAQALDISVSTLYSYVSRGIIRSEEGDDDSRRRRYLAEDVRRILAKRETVKTPEKAVKKSLHWGEMPLLDSALTLIQDGHLYYRGQDVADLVQNNTLEEVAGLVWTGDLDAGDQLFTRDHRIDAKTIQKQLPKTNAFSLLEMGLSLAKISDFQAYNLKPAQVAQTGARILRLMVDLQATHSRATLAETLNQAWLGGKRDASTELNAALILCADHELNASSFTARVTASAQANPYAVVSAGLATLTGAKHGAATESVAAFLREIEANRGDVYGTVSLRLRRGESIPGFGHKLYPDGDPRAVILLDYARAYAGGLPQLEVLLKAVEELTGLRPTIDVGLVMLCQALDIPTNLAMVIFALGRTVGWIGHAIEEYAQDIMIRPRARYVGEMPKE